MKFFKKHGREKKVKHFQLQKDQSDCGVVCLQNILQYYNNKVSLERLREMSGSDADGTTMLGLYQAAEQLGFAPMGAAANSIHDLKTLDHPCILHTVTDQHTHHYIICYGWKGSVFITGDPAKGLYDLKEQELDMIWRSKKVLLLQPTAVLDERAVQYRKRRTWFYLIARRYGTILTIAAFLGLAASVLSLSMAIFSQKMVDSLLKEAPLKKIYLSIGLLGLLLFIKSFINFIRGYLLAKQSKEFNTEVTKSFYFRLLHLPKSFFDTRKTGDLVARLNDTNRIQQTVSYFASDVSIQSIMLLVATVILFLYSVKAGIAGLFFIPLVMFAVRKFQPAILSRQKKMMEAYAQNESNYIDNIKGIGIIKLFNRESFFFNKASDLFAGAQEVIFAVSKTRIRFTVAIDTLATLFLMTLVLICVSEIQQKELQVGEFIAILQIGALLTQTAATVALSNIQLQEAKVAFDRMDELTGIAPEADHQEQTDAPVPPFSFEKLEMRDIVYCFPGRKPLLEQVSLEVNNGNIIAITGESGQGKSTIFQIIQKFYRQQEGSILLNGILLDQVDTRTWRKVIGVVTQEPALFSGTAFDNILLGNAGTADKESIIAFCRQTGFHDYFSKFPQGYHTLLGEGGTNISGGQKQLVCLARCLYHQPQVLLLDEPTAAMDKRTENFVIGLLKKLRTGKGMILISHKDALTGIADSIYKLENGRLYACTRAYEAERIGTALVAQETLVSSAV